MYNPIPDLLIMGTFVLSLALILYVTRKKPRGATPETNLAKLRTMQQIRRMENE